MKLDSRDLLWSVGTLILLSLLGLEWRRSYLLGEEIRARNTADAPLEFVNSQLQDAAFFLEAAFRARCEYDWPSMQPLGMTRRTLVTRTIPADNAAEAFRQLFGDQVEVVEDTEASQILHQPVLRVRAVVTRRND